MTRVFILILSLFLLASCRSTKKIQTAIGKKDSAAAVGKPGAKATSDSAQFIATALQQLESNRISFNSFTGKVDLDYRDAAGKKYDLNAVIRMQKDSIIWVSVSAVLGIEAMRIIVTQDSVKLLDKLNKSYIARSVDYLQEVSALPLNLTTLQDLIIGNPVFLERKNIVSYTRSGESISLLSIGQWFKNLVTISEENKTLRHSKLDDVNIAQSRTADLTYSDYENKKGVRFATKRRILVAEKKKLDISLNFKQYNFDEELTFPFSIPKNYEAR